MFLSKNKSIDFKKKFMLEKTVNEWHSLSSIRSYNSLFYHIENDKNLDLENISETFNISNILDFFQKKSEKWSPKTYNFYIKKFKTFLKFLHREEKIWKIYELLRYKKEDKNLPKFIDFSELQTIFNMLEEKEKIIIKIFIFTWVRRFEFSSIKKENINFETWEIKIFWKWRKERVIPIHSSILEDLKNFDEVKLNTIDNLRRKIQKRFPKFKLHNLRHTFATFLIREKANIYIVSQLLWHKNINTTTTYLSLDTTSMREELEKIKFDFF